MSWFARSLASSFTPDPEGGDIPQPPKLAPVAEAADGSDGSGTGSPTRGVKEDISQLTKTLSRQLWGVASFLAPPPQSPHHGRRDESPPSPQTGDSSSSSSSSSPLNRGLETGHSDPVLVKEEDRSDVPGISGIRSDFAEIGGRFRSEISKLSSNKAVSEFSKIASTFLPFGADTDEEDEDGRVRYADKVRAVGVTEEVLAFARNISMHPETWLDYPLLPDEEDTDDFDMSDTQHEHALAIERLAPRLAALRIELCPSHMSEGCFWKIYFVLLHPRLNKEDAEKLSTPQIVEARAMLLQELQNRAKPESYKTRSTSYGKEPPTQISEHPTPSGGFHDGTTPISPLLQDNSISPSKYLETEKHLVKTTEIKIVDKSIVQEDQPNLVKGLSSGNSKVPIETFDDDGDDWLKDEGTEMGGSDVMHIDIGNEEDVSFSDLEEEDDRITPAISNEGNCNSTNQNKESRDWVQPSDGSSKLPKNGKSIPENEPNEWLDVEDIDLV